MAFSDQQNRFLKAKLNAEHVKQAKRMASLYITSKGGMPSPRQIGFLASMAGIEIPSPATAFGPELTSVRAGDVIIVREGSGTGEGKAATPGQAHELALKSAETDATKRALATFGNVFGLALYHREQAGVRQVQPSKPAGSKSFAPGAMGASFVYRRAEQKLFQGNRFHYQSE